MIAKDSGRRSLNRMPVVTFTLMGLIALFFLVYQVIKSDPDDAYEDAISYYVSHGYLHGDVNLEVELTTNGYLTLQWLRSRAKRIEQYKENRRRGLTQDQETSEEGGDSEDRTESDYQEDSTYQQDEDSTYQQDEDSTYQQDEDSTYQQDGGEASQQDGELHFENQMEELEYYQSSDHSFDESDKIEQAHLDDLLTGALRPAQKKFSLKLGVQPAQPKWWTFVTFPLIHHGSFQVLVVLLMMFLTAPYVEDRWSRWFLLVLFYGGSFIGLLVSWKLHPSSAFYGAECGVTTLLAAYLVRYPNERLRYAFLVPLINLKPILRFGCSCCTGASFKNSMRFFGTGSRVPTIPASCLCWRPLPWV